MKAIYLRCCLLVCLLWSFLDSSLANENRLASTSNIERHTYFDYSNLLVEAYRIDLNDIYYDLNPIQVDTQKQGLETQLSQPNWGIGTKWYYEYRSSFPPQVTAMKYEITDTTNFKGEDVFVLKTPEGDTYLKTFEGKAWIYIDEMDDYQLTYDFNLSQETTFLWDAMCPDSVDGASTHIGTMVLDSIQNFTLPDGSASQMQFITYEESTPMQTFGKFNRRVLNDIGFDYGGLGLNTGYLTCTNVLSAYTDLRCFENDGVLYNFRTYACDSTWLIVNTKELEQVHFEIYPNPSSGRFTITEDFSKPISFKLYTLDGRLIDGGESVSHHIQVNANSGVYILRVRIDDFWYNRRVIIY